MPACSTTPFTVNRRTYSPPARPIVVICLDGSSDEYLDAAMTRGRMPATERLVVGGFRGMARSALPSFTNTNNASIATGVPPCEHGISGNFFYDSASDKEVMMNSARYLRVETILAAAARVGRRVAVGTAKDKLRDMLSSGLEGIGFSAEKAGEAREESHGISDLEEFVGEKTPGIYSAAASLFILRAGVALLERALADFLYLSLTDYVQHKHAPEEPEALDFYEAIDREIARLAGLGAVIGATADHGMNAKQQPDGSPHVIYLESLLAEQLGEAVRVILPITDPYVKHHGALGSFAVVHLPEPELLPGVKERILSIRGVTEVYDRAQAAAKLELPADRIGDLVVLSGRDVVLGRRPEKHDLSAVATGLRSHGGRYEEMVPFLLSEPLSPAYAAKARGDLRNFDIFDYTVNGSCT